MRTSKRFNELTEQQQVEARELVVGKGRRSNLAPYLFFVIEDNKIVDFTLTKEIRMEKI